MSMGRTWSFAFRCLRQKQRCNLRNLSPLPMMAERALKKRPAVTSSRYCDDVLDRMPDTFYLVCQRLEGVAHLLKVLVAVVNAANAADGMTEAALGGVGVDARARHQRACRASQVVKPPTLCPSRRAAGDVELELERAEARDRRAGVGREGIIAANNARQLLKHTLGRRRQRQCRLRARLAALAGDGPIAVRDFAPHHAGNLRAPSGGEQ